MSPDTPSQEAFQRLLDAHAAALRRFCCVNRGEPDDRQDLLQEIVMALWTALPRFRGDASERTWVFRIAQNVAFSDAARRGRWRRREVPLDEATTMARSDNERQRELFDAVRRLPPVDRQLASLYLEGLTAREIGEVLGITEGNAAVRLTRLRQQLARMLGTGEVRRG